MSKFEIGDVATLKRVTIAKKQKEPEGTLYQCESIDALGVPYSFCADDEMLTEAPENKEKLTPDELFDSNYKELTDDLKILRNALFYKMFENLFLKPKKGE